MSLRRFVFGRWQQAANGQPGGMDQMYREGGFDFLYSLEELSHYMVILGYIRHFTKGPSILDVGCGEGRLAELLSPQDYGEYHGIDISSVAIERARKKSLPATRFTATDLTTWEPDHRYDLMVFCESLYYIPRPLEAMLHYVPYLAEKGHLIVSIYRFLDQEQIWEGIDRAFHVCGRDTVQNARGTWDIRIYTPGNTQ